MSLSFYHLQCLSIHHFYLLSVYERIYYQAVGIKAFLVHINACYLTVFVGGVVVNAFVSVAAGGIDGYFLFALCYLVAASLLVNRTEYMEELAYALRFGAARL